MSSNFLDKSGLATGSDAHMFFTVAPPPAPPVPVPVPLTAHGVASAHFYLSRSWHIAHTVTTDAYATLQSGWAMIVVPHMFLTGAPPHPAAEPINLLAIIAASSAAPMLSAHSVTGEGTALCTALVGCYGLNLDCGDAPIFGRTHDFNLNSVKTSPTLGDYLNALWSTAVNLAYAYVLGWAVGNLQIEGQAFKEIVVQALDTVAISVWQTLLDVLSTVCSDVSSWIGDPVAVIAGKVGGLLQQGADAAAGNT